MIRFTTLLLWAGLGCTAACQSTDSKTHTQSAPIPSHSPAVEPIESRVDAHDHGRSLIQTVRVEAPVEQVWSALTTADGWTAWAVPKASVDLRPGGHILTQYNLDRDLGDEGTNTLRILNFVPQRVLTLQADVQPNWPEVMKLDAENLMNVIVLTAEGEGATRIESYGLGYGDRQEYDRMLDFFLEANEGLYRNLIRYLEQGQRVDWSLRGS